MIKKWGKENLDYLPSVLDMLIGDEVYKDNPRLMESQFEVSLALCSSFLN